jgi:uncharacterized protein YfdQ (DUF2303 family)
MKLEELLKDVRVGETTTFDIAGEAGNRKVTVELRKLLPEEARPPKRAESPAKNHVFLSAASLADYLAKYGGKDTVVFADPTQELIAAVLDERAKDGFEVVTMRPAVDQRWKPWADLAGKRIGIKAFAEFIAQNRRAIVAETPATSDPFSVRELVMSLSQIRASVSIEAQHGSGKEAVNGVVIRTKIQGVEKSQPVDLPDSITIRVPLYVATDPHDIELDLTLDADTDGSVSVLVAASTVLEAKVAAFEQMCATVREGTATTGATVTLGRPAHAAWPYLRELEAK